jgi:hypothetical protein
MIIIKHVLLTSHQSQPPHMEDRMADPARKKHTFMIDLEKLNTLNAEGCPACGHKFTLGETVVLACGAWEGCPKLIHENEAIWDSRSGSFFERACYTSRKD